MNGVPTEERVSDERLRYLTVTHFNVDFLPDYEEFRDIQRALAELSLLRSHRAEQGSEAAKVDADLPEGFTVFRALDYIKTDEDLAEYVAAAIELAAPRESECKHSFNPYTAKCIECGAYDPDRTGG